MITLHLPDDLARELGIAPHSRHAPRQSLGELLEAVEAVTPGLLPRIMEADGRTRRHLNLFVGETRVRREDARGVPLRDGDEVWLLRAISGG